MIAILGVVITPDEGGVAGRRRQDVAVVVLPADVGLHVALARAQEHVAEEHVVERGACAGGAGEEEGGGDGGGGLGGEAKDECS
jgi:hypothetical protein